MSEANAVPAPVPGNPAKPKRVYPTDSRERALLALSLGLGILLADLLLALWEGFVGLEVTLAVAAWEGGLLWYARGEGGLPASVRRGPGLWLTAAVGLLALSFSLCSARWLWLLDLCALAGTMTVQMFQLFGPARWPWTSPVMLAERVLLLFQGLFGQLGAPLQTAAGLKKGPGRRGLYVLLGLVCVLPVLMLVVPLLTSADAVFGHVAEGAVRFLCDRFGSLLVRVVLGLCAAPALFSLLYFLRRGVREPAPAAPAGAPLAVDPLLPVTVLLPLDLLYLFFVAVQSAALFGGERYLAAAGVSYAEYARSGFFQLVWVSAIDLAVVVAAVHFCRREGPLWLWVRVLATAMAALSGVMLCSAAWRMSLYVGTYGLSLKRALTYWGMVLLAVFLAAALLKVWRREFGFFRVFFAASLAGWLLLNAVNVDALVARYNVDAYLAGNVASIDLRYCAGLSYDALPALEKLPGDMSVFPDSDSPSMREYTLDQLLAERRASAAREAGDWRTWSLSAWLAAREGGK